MILALESKSLLLGESASKDAVEQITKAIRADGSRIIHLKTLHLGPEELVGAFSKLLPGSRWPPE